MLDNGSVMNGDRSQLSATSLAVLSLSVMVCLSAPASARTPAETGPTDQRSNARTSERDQRQALAALLGSFSDVGRRLPEQPVSRASGTGVLINESEG